MAAAFALLASSCHDGGQRGVGTEPMAQIAVEKHAEILSLPVEVKAKRVTIQEGLPSNVVSDMQQDQKGFLWFSTHNGLARYDGNVVTTYWTTQYWRLCFNRSYEEGFGGCYL